MAIDLLPQFVLDNYEVHEWKHATAILAQDFPQEFLEICNVLTNFRLPRSSLVVGGGNRSNISRSIDSAFYDLGWEEKKFETSIVVDSQTYDSPTHKVDCFKNRVALEIEWNNKDPFFDRDLNNFRLLFELRVASVGVVITRCDELEGLLRELRNSTNAGASTTHMSKLLPKINGGGGGGCPLLVFGISRRLYVED